MLTVKDDKSLSVSVVRLSLFLLTALLPALSAGAEQQTEAAQEKGPKPVGVVNSSNGSVFQKGQYSIIFKYGYFTQDQLYNGSDKVDFVSPQQGEKPGKKNYEKTLQRYRLVLRTGLSKDVDVRLILPVSNRELKRQSFSGDFTDNQSGLGDIKLLSRYQMFSQKKKDAFNLAFGAGVSLPTGSTDEKDSSGATLPGFLQPGSGSLDPIVELGAHKLYGRSMVSGYVKFQLTTGGEAGDQDFERPDVFSYNLGYVYALSNVFDVQLEMNGMAQNKAKLDGIEHDNTGGHTIYLTPGIHVKFWRKMHVDLGVPTVIYRNLNGTQLSEDYRVIAKLAMPF